MESEFPGDLDPSLPGALARLREGGPAVLEVSTGRDAWEIDRLLDGFYGLYCDFERPDFLRSFDDLVRLHEYERAGRYLPEPFRELWAYLQTGRAVGRDSRRFPYESEDGEYRLGYWTASECVELLGAIDPPRMGFWTDPSSEESVVAARVALRSAIDEGLGLIFAAG